MRRSLLAMIALVGGAGLACGGGPMEEPQGGSIGFDIYVSRAVIEDVGAFQLALRKSGGCAGITRTCLRDQVTQDALVTFTTLADKKTRALRVPVELTAEGEFQTQDVTLQNVPVGRDYALIVEALTRSDPPELLAISCRPGIEVRQGQNATVISQPLDLPEGGPVPCDPRID